MKKWMVFAAALLLAGCGEDTDGWVPGAEPVPQGPPSTPATAAPAAPALAQVDAHCRDVARQRSMDGKNFGYDRDTLKAIYDDAYQECVAWRTPRAR